MVEGKTIMELALVFSLVFCLVAFACPGLMPFALISSSCPEAARFPQKSLARTHEADSLALK
jgi:hypothetical protein